jgi:hypothetical protein
LARVNHLALVVEEVRHPEVHRFLEVVVVEVDILLVALVEEVVHHRVAEVEAECHMVVVAEVLLHHSVVSTKLPPTSFSSKYQTTSFIIQ